MALLFAKQESLRDLHLEMVVKHQPGREKREKILLVDSMPRV